VHLQSAALVLAKQSNKADVTVGKLQLPGMELHSSTMRTCNRHSAASLAVPVCQAVQGLPPSMAALGPASETQGVYQKTSALDKYAD
jgi:hypothetical protein